MKFSWQSQLRIRRWEETIVFLLTKCSIYKLNDKMSAIHIISESFLKWVVVFKLIWKIISNIVMFCPFKPVFISDFLRMIPEDEPLQSQQIFWKVYLYIWYYLRYFVINQLILWTIYTTTWIISFYWVSFFHQEFPYQTSSCMVRVLQNTADTHDDFFLWNRNRSRADRKDLLNIWQNLKINGWSK